MDLSGQRKLPANNGFSLTQLQPDGIDKHWLFQTRHVKDHSVTFGSCPKYVETPKSNKFVFFVSFTFSEVFWITNILLVRILEYHYI